MTIGRGHGHEPQPSDAYEPDRMDRSPTQAEAEFYELTRGGNHPLHRAYNQRDAWTSVDRQAHLHAVKRATELSGIIYEERVSRGEAGLLDPSNNYGTQEQQRQHLSEKRRFAEQYARLHPERLNDPAYAHLTGENLDDEGYTVEGQQQTPEPGQTTHPTEGDSSSLYELGSDGVYRPTAEWRKAVQSGLPDAS